MQQLAQNLYMLGLGICDCKGELEASRSMGDRYVLVLVANCLTDKPKLQILANPWDVIEKQGLTLEPIVYRVRSSV